MKKMRFSWDQTRKQTAKFDILETIYTQNGLVVASLSQSSIHT